MLYESTVTSILEKEANDEPHLEIKKQPNAKFIFRYERTKKKHGCLSTTSVQLKNFDRNVNDIIQIRCSLFRPQHCLVRSHKLVNRMEPRKKKNKIRLYVSSTNDYTARLVVLSTLPLPNIKNFQFRRTGHLERFETENQR